jgi:hypothetical protein
VTSCVFRASHRLVTVPANCSGSFIPSPKCISLAVSQTKALPSSLRLIHCWVFSLSFLRAKTLLPKHRN